MQGERVALPRFKILGTSADVLPSTKEQAASIASAWLRSFAQHIDDRDVSALVNLFIEDPATPCFWRDILALTWDFRTFQGKDKIAAFLTDRLGPSGLRGLHLIEGTTSVGTGRGVVRIVPTVSQMPGSISWKAHTVLTDLNDLHGLPEAVGLERANNILHGVCEERQREEKEFEEEDPTVLVVGAGQAGLAIAARLKFLDIKTLIIERQPRIGDQWRARYKSLCLHDPVYFDHMPYLPFPSTWPVYTPACKLAGWLEQYAHSLDLAVWTSSTISRATQDPRSHKWTATVKRGVNGSERTFLVNHLIFAMGTVGGKPIMPNYPGMDMFKGQILHSSAHKSAAGHAKKKVVVLGACTSAHDVCADYVDRGIDVTMIQRNSTFVMSVKEGMHRALPMHTAGGPPTDVADLITVSYPFPLVRSTQRLVTRAIAQADRHMLEGLKARGFKLNSGYEGTGFHLLAYLRGGGYYFDTGASQMIIDGRIKLKSDSAIKQFTEHGIEFADGTHLPADVVVCATGYEPIREQFREILGDDMLGRLKPLWGFNREGEVNGLWRDSGVPGLWMMMGSLFSCRVHSKHLALQIKAIEEGLLGERYSAVSKRRKRDGARL